MDSSLMDIAQIRVPPPDEVLQKALADLDARLAAWKAALGELRAEVLEQARSQAEAYQELQTKAEQYAQRQAELESHLAAQTQTEQQSKTRADTHARTEQDLEARERAQAEAEERLRKQSEAQAAAQQELDARLAQVERAEQELEKRAQAQIASQAAPPAQAEGLTPSPETQDPDRSADLPPNTSVDWSSADVSKHVRVYGDAAKASTASRSETKAQPTSEDEALLASLDPETAKAIKVMRRMRGDKKSVRELLEQYQAAQASAKPDSSKKSWFRRGR